MMNYASKLPLGLIVAAAACLPAACGAQAAEPGVAHAEPRPTAAEAEARAELLHETIHAVLHVVHHQYYREDEGLAIPAATLKKVFGELAERKHVELRWLAVDGEAMNSDHAARTEFERKAVAALAAGKGRYVEAEGDVLRHAGAIRLTSECLKCHAPRRTSTEDRTAGLVISLPFRPENAAEGGHD
jgi:hypothetical protein